MDAPHALEPDDAPEDVVAGAGDPGRRWLRFAPLAAALAALVAAVLLGAPHYLSLDVLSEQRASLTAFVARHPVQSVLVYVAVYCAIVGLGIPGALVMTLSGGFLFGTLLGSLAAAVGVSAGAVVMFLITRSAFGDLLLSRFPEGGRMKRMEARIREHAFSYLLTLRLIPMVPLSLVNIAASLVRMKLSVYASATVLGVLPSCLVYASMGAGLGHVFDRGGRLEPELALDPQIVLPLVGLLVLSLVPLVVHRIRRRRALLRPLG